MDCSKDRGHPTFFDSRLRHEKMEADAGIINYLTDEDLFIIRQRLREMPHDDMVDQAVDLDIPWVAYDVIRCICERNLMPTSKRDTPTNERDIPMGKMAAMFTPSADKAIDDIIHILNEVEMGERYTKWAIRFIVMNVPVTHKALHKWILKETQAAFKKTQKPKKSATRGKKSRDDDDVKVTTTPEESGLAAAHKSLVKYAAMYQGAYGSIHSIKFYGSHMYSVDTTSNFSWKYGMLVDIIAGNTPVDTLKDLWYLFEDMSCMTYLHAYGNKAISTFLRGKNVMPPTAKYYLYRGRLEYAKNVLSIGADFSDDDDENENGTPDNDEEFIEDIIKEGYYDCFEFLVDYGTWADHAIISGDSVKKLCMDGILVLYRDDEADNMSMGDVRDILHRRRGVNCRGGTLGCRGYTDVMIETAD